MRKVELRRDEFGFGFSSVTLGAPTVQVSLAANNASRTLTVGGAIGDGGLGYGLAAAGTCTLILTGSNTYTGATDGSHTNYYVGKTGTNNYLQISGGGDLHNMDAYAVFVSLLALYFIGDKVQPPLLPPIFQLLDRPGDFWTDTVRYSIYRQVG